MPLMHRFKAEMARRAMARLPMEKLVPRTATGSGAAAHTGPLAAKLKMTRALVVTDKILVQLGVVDASIASLREAGIEVVVFDEVEPDPTIEHVMAGAKLYMDNQCDGLVAIGGGSSIDCAKVVGAYVRDPRPIETFAGLMKVKKGIPPLVAVPTTHGTGSETTYAAVITSTQDKRKFLVTDFKLMPRAAVLDPELVKGLPPSVSAATGMDALTHAVEAYLSPWATDFSRSRSVAAVKGVMNYLLRCYHNGDTDVEARAALLQASFDAGVAISVGAVGYVHAFAHTVGVEFHTPHGVANAMFLPLILDHYGAAVTEPLAELAVHAGLGSSSEKPVELARRFVQRIRDMSAEMKLPTTIEGLRTSHLDRVATSALLEAHGERHSMLFNFGDFMKDAGYPVPGGAYLSHAAAVSLAAKVLPPNPRAKL